MTKKRTSAKPKAKQGKKAAQPAYIDVSEVESADTTAAAGEIATTSATAAASTPVDASTVVPTSTIASRRANRLNRQQAKALPMEEEYAYVVNDLRRVFILAGIMFLGLIVVNLVFTFLSG